MTETIKDVLKDIRTGNITKEGLIYLISINTRKEFQPVFRNPREYAGGISATGYSSAALLNFQTIVARDVFTAV